MKFIILNFFALLLFLLQACYENDNQLIPQEQLRYNYQTFKIAAGSHNSSNFKLQRIEFLPLITFEQSAESTFQFNFEFLGDPSYEFTGAQAVEQQDWNKLFGFSDCGNFDAFTGHGALLGWRWNPKLKKLELASYVHAGGDKTRSVTEFNTKINPNNVYYLKIILQKSSNYDRYQFVLSNHSSFSAKAGALLEKHIHTRGCKGSSYIGGRIINPWFGGTLPSPRNLEIRFGVVE